MNMQAEDMPRATGEEIVAAIRELDRQTDETPYSPRQVAELLGLSTHAIRAHDEEWGLEFHHISPGSKHRRIRHADLVRWLRLRPEFDFALKEIEETS
jgi:hypothetical protein